MESITVEIELPRELLVALNISATQAGQKAKEWVIIELFREGEILGGKAGELLGMTKSEFIAFLDQRGLAYLDSAPGELAAELETALQTNHGMKPYDPSHQPRC